MEYILADNFYRDDLDSREVMVSIHCITYNHEKYLRDALEGFVMQKTNFRFEAIVHDDASTDGTAAILREYAEKYPSIIKPIFETENQYSKADGSLSRIMNAHLRGKYIAFCEGDDYWTDPLKLQKQVDFLESHPDYSMCYTAAKALNIKKSKYYNLNGKPIFDAIILIKGNIIPTPTTMIRKSVNDSYLQNCKITHCKLLMGDYPLWLYSITQGSIGYLEDITTIYRILESSASHKNTLKKKLQFIDSYFFIKDFFIKELKLDYKDFDDDLNRSKFRYCVEYNNIEESRTYFSKIKAKKMKDYIRKIMLELGVWQIIKRPLGLELK